MIETFAPLLEAARGLDLRDPERARAELARRFDPTGPAARALNAALVRLDEEGKIAERGALPVRYGRVAKASEATGGFSIDVVHMSGPGARHRHPQGEKLPHRARGTPTFVGRFAERLVVEPPEPSTRRASRTAYDVVLQPRSDRIRQVINRAAPPRGASSRSPRSRTRSRSPRACRSRRREGNRPCTCA